MTGGVARNTEEDLSTPSLSIEQPVASPTTPTNKWGTIPHSLPGNFSVAEPLTPDIQPTHPFYATSSQYQDSFSQGMHRTTAAPAITSLHNFPVFGYPCQSPFSTRSPIQQCGELPSPYQPALHLLFTLSYPARWTIAGIHRYRRSPSLRSPKMYAYSSRYDAIPHSVAQGSPSVYGYHCPFWLIGSSAAFLDVVLGIRCRGFGSTRVVFLYVNPDR